MVEKKQTENGFSCQNRGTVSVYWYTYFVRYFNHIYNIIVENTSHLRPIEEIKLLLKYSLKFNLPSTCK